MHLKQIILIYMILRCISNLCVCVCVVYVWFDLYYLDQLF